MAVEDSESKAKPEANASVSTNGEVSTQESASVEVQARADPSPQAGARADAATEVQPVEIQAKPEPVETKSAPLKPVTTRPLASGITQRRFSQMSRRELLKIAPVIALGAFAIPSFQDSLLKKG